jgi:glycopeptide antibiotics resistance protein
MLEVLPLPPEWISLVGRYMAFGTFDVADVIATTAGACAAAAVLFSVHPRGVKP